jgi:voltage-gated potassium channel
MANLKAKLRDVFYNSESKSFLIINDGLALLTLISTFAIILETVSGLASYKSLLDGIEYVAVFFFTLEYLGRIIASNRKARYIFSFFGIIDLISIVPTYFGLANLTFLKTTRVLRLLRFLRMIRLTKVARAESQHIKDFEEHSKLYKLNIQIYFFALFSAIILSAALLYALEGHQAHTANIPMAMLWTARIIMSGVVQVEVSTLAGELVIILTRFTGLILFGLLIHVVGSAAKRLLFGSTDITLDDDRDRR